MNREKMYRSDECYRRELNELKARAAARVAIEAVDSCEIGNKYTTCNVGLCDDSFRDTADGVYHTWKQACPHDARWFTPEGAKLEPRESGNGCFYTCRIFNKDKSDPYARIAAVEIP